MNTQDVSKPENGRQRCRRGSAHGFFSGLLIGGPRGSRRHLQPLNQTNASEHSRFANAFMQALRNNDGVIDGARLFASLGSPAAYGIIDGTGHRDGDFLFVPRNR